MTAPYIKIYTCTSVDRWNLNLDFEILYCIHTKKLSCLKSGVEFDMNDILYEFKNLHHFKDSLTFGVKAVLVSSPSRSG